ncbi:MAG: hypothetical protein K1X64_10860 [Myxococcaceae bacterium]|nr:hypothetical protein [Myxococcaceae bacterium]
MLATTVPYGMATSLVEKLCGIEVSIKGAEEMTWRRGEAVLSQNAAEAEKCAGGYPSPSQCKVSSTKPMAALPRATRRQRCRRNDADLLKRATAILERYRFNSVNDAQAHGLASRTLQRLKAVP